MRTYLISYDLANPAAKKHALTDIIMSLGMRWARPLETTWYITTPETGADIEAQIAWILGDEDGLLIQAVDDPAVLTNTALRWFRRRGGVAEGGPHTAEGTVVAFASRSVAQHAGLAA
ncbi:MAG: hypothetical protein NW217_17085 [Hyphomicrobiaceae bacterium]|nr:hypothetical protein [Hyphomicrobiaceae bacterium]